ncbi:MAG TPA: exodeoxyribonuclease VII small subunit [Bryobacteraceae bacterium]|nr:exodeoxyribonuclease VII small subunit [Bryobacteraceae bacterium]
MSEDQATGQTSQPNFETSLGELERVVKELEQGDLPLERSLELFESGMRLSADCKRLLEEAESRVEILTKRGSEMIAVPYTLGNQPEKQAR